MPDSAFDVALQQIVAALDPLVKTFEHAARLLAGAARAVEGNVVAARTGDDAEIALDQREVLPILPEQGRGEPVIVEGERDLGRVPRSDSERLAGPGVRNLDFCGGKIRLRHGWYPGLGESTPNSVLPCTYQ